MKKQYNYYMDDHCKAMIAFIRAQDPQGIQMLNDSQIVERLIRKRAEALGYKDKDHFTYYESLRVK